MPANNPRQPRRSWKDDKPAGARPGPAQRGWQQEQATPGGKKGPLLTRRGKIALAAGALLVGVIVLVIILYKLRRIDPPRFVLIGAGYETNLAVPENVHGVRGLDQLKDWADGYNAANGAGSPAIDLKRQELTTEGGDPFDAALKGSNAPKVIVYVAVHGAADSQGPYFIPHDANPRNNAYASYRVGKALAALKALPPGTKKLLILDTTSVESDATLGLLHNDFVRALLEDKKALTDVPNLAVMIASSEDQRSWVSEEWGTSIFTHFVVEGLKGAAAVNGEVTAQSLYDYVKKEVEQWARDNRGALQTPYLFDDAGIASGMELFAADAGKYTPPVAADLPAFTEPPGLHLQAAWKTRGELETSQPSPAVYTPQLWRQYLDTLKRYEDLLRANDPASATTMAGELTKLEGRIRQSQRVEREALALSLAMPAALGWSLSDAELKRAPRKDFDDLWRDKAKGKDYAGKVKDWQETVTDPLRRHLMRLRMDSLLLRQALQSEADFATVCDILPQIDDELAPRRPAEAHFALMLNRHLEKKGRNWAQMKKVLEVRLQAEEAALGFDAETRVPVYSEQVLPWIQSDTGKPSPDKASVERADAFRRAGEDLSFASARKAADAAAATDKAKAEYDDLQGKALVVRHALAARDKALAELPYYTVWFATLPFDEGEETQHVALWDTVHRLCALLEKPNFDKIDELTKPAKDVEEGLRLLAARFKKSLPDVRADTQKPWHEIHNLLQVPFIPHDRRMELLIQLRATSHQLNAKPPTGTPGVSKAQNSANEERAAQRRGRLALAVLGKHHPASKDAEPAITRPDESAWGRSLAKASERIAEAYRQMAVDVYANTEKGSEAPLKEAHALLRPAALQARQLPGAAAASWPLLDPVGENRKVDLHDLLAYQARRTFDDYWAGDDPKQPYYRDAGLVYLSAAAALAGSADATLPPAAKKARLADCDSLTALLGQDDTLTPRWYDGPDAKPGPALLYITDEDRVTRRFRLDKAATAPDGIPVAWTEVGPGLKPAKPEDLEPRALVRDKNDAADAPLEFDLIPKQVEGGETLPKEKSSYTFKGFFRGHVAKLETTTYLFHQPEVTSYQPEFPKTGRIAIRSSQGDYERFAAANSELVIVLDFSGSMKEITKETKGKAQERSRKQEALAALKKCLVKVPNGVRVTLLTFSEEGGGGDINPQWKQIAWNRSSEAVADRILQLDRLAPLHETPLARATAEAKDYFSPGFEGNKAVLVITDGGDSEFPNPPDASGKALIAKYGSMQKYLLAQYPPKSGIQVKVIGIETDSLQGREKEGLEMYRPAIEALGGEFVPVTESAKLAQQIEKFILQIHYRVDDESGHSPSDDNGDVSQSADNYQWMRNLAPGTYMANLLTNRRADKGNEKKAVEQRVRLERGDALVLQLLPVPNSKQFMLRREMYAESFDVTNRKRVFAQKAVENSWLVSVLQNQKFETGRSAPPLKLMTVIEKRDSPTATAKTPLQLFRPPFVWFNVATGDAPRLTPGGLRFYPLADYPAAAYSLDLPEWPETKEPVLDVWWTEDAPPDCGVLRPENGKRLMDGQHVRYVQPTNQEERTRIVVESIAYKPMRVELKPTDFRPDVDCVVVRLRWDPVKSGPFFAMLPEELRATGSEHRFYLEAGKYTGVFYNVSEDKLKALEQLTLYSVEGVKLKAHNAALKVGTPNTTPRPEKPHD